MRIYSLTIALLLFSFPLSAQLCEGNLGENIFEAGDFGTGVPNVVAVNPGIAPGYIYTTAVPPGDGLYTITNNTAAWPGLYPTWLGIPDNSTDPQGYMMVVNASFSPGLFYEQEVDGLCENTLYVFSADIINMVKIGVPDHIDPNISFLIDGVEQFNTGNIAQTEQWDTYGFVFTTLPGQTTVTLSLRNNAPGGIGNDVALDNISFKPCGPQAQILPLNVERICEDDGSTELIATINGDQYPSPALQWQLSLDEGMNWNDIAGATDTTYTITNLSSGFYYYRYLLANGTANLASNKCRVNSNVKIVEVVPKLWSVFDTICEGATYDFGDSIYTQTGVYEDSLISTIGCDSIVTLNLTALSDPDIQADIELTQPLCSGDLGSLSFMNVINGFPAYSYMVGDSLSGENSTFTNLEEGEYDLRVTDRFGCTFETAITITPAIPFTIDLGPDQSIELGETVQFSLRVTGDIASYNWSPLPEGCEPGCENEPFVPFGTNSYTLTAISDDGCVAIDSARVNVQPIRQLYMPNAFSPNLDGVNDFFAPIVILPNVQSIQRFQVFNRWGAVVYEQRDFLPTGLSAGWDGQFKGRPVQNGVFAYQLEVLFLDGAVINYSGSVTVLR